MAKKKITMNVETTCTPIKATLQFPTVAKRSLEAITETEAKAGFQRLLDDGIYTLTVPAKGQPQGTLVKISATGKNSAVDNNGGETVSADGTIVAELVFGVSNGEVA